jgi:hypothetical protein
MRIISGETFSRSFRIDKISEISFEHCTFLNCLIPPLDNVNFNRCKFVGGTCPVTSGRLSGSNYAARHINQATMPTAQVVFFHNCEFNSVTFVGGRLTDFWFVKCTFSGVKFENCDLNGRFVLDQCTGITTIDLDHTNTFSDTYSDVINQCNIAPVNKFSAWTKIQWLFRLPLAQIGFTAVSAYVFLVPLFNYAMEGVRQRCGIVLEKFREAGVFLPNTVCEAVPSLALTYYQKLFLANCLLLAMVSLVHRIIQPSTIREYSAQTWNALPRRPKVRYIFSNHRMLGVRILIIGGYVAAILIFAGIYAQRFWPYL